MSDIILWVAGSVGYLLIGAVFAGLSVRLSHEREPFDLPVALVAIGWPVLLGVALPTIVICYYFRAVEYIAWRVAGKPDYSKLDKARVPYMDFRW